MNKSENISSRVSEEKKVALYDPHFPPMEVLKRQIEDLRKDIVVKEGNLNRRYLKRLTQEIRRGPDNASEFCQELRELLTRIKRLKSEVLQSLIELRGGLDSDQAFKVISLVADFIKSRDLKGRPSTWELLGLPPKESLWPDKDKDKVDKNAHLVLIPPSEDLEERDMGFYERSKKLYEYIIDKSKGGNKYQEEVIYKWGRISRLTKHQR